MGGEEEELAESAGERGDIEVAEELSRRGWMDGSGVMEES